MAGIPGRLCRAAGSPGAPHNISGLKKMRAFQVEKTGEAPQIRRIDPPEPGPSQALVRVAACGLNFADLLQIEGRYQERLTPPFTLGMEISGVIERLGPGTAGPAPGSRVAVLTSGGGLADYAVVPVDRCVVLPDGMDDVTAAAFQIAYGTSHLALLRRARLAPGERLLVTGAAGGVGLTAVEIGAAAGAHVIALARGADKLAVARAAGAHEVIDSTAIGDALKSVLKAGGGIDVVYETIGGETFDAALGALRPEGRMLAIGFAGGTVPSVKANYLLVKNLSVIGVYYGGYNSFAPDILKGGLAELIAWHADGRIRPHVSHVLPLEEAAAALALVRERRSTGKVVVRCAP